MIKYVHYFDTNEEFLAKYNSSAYTAPWVSYTKENGDINYNKSQSIEIGGFEWSTVNVGAANPWEPGLYFQWADESGYTSSQVGSGEGKKYFDDTDYKYNGPSKYNRTDGLTVLELTDDGVYAALGGEWRIPSRNEFEALAEATTSAWTTNYQGTGVNGMLLTDKTDPSKTLFFPAAGYAFKGEMYGRNSRGNYWSREGNPENNTTSAYCTTFVSSKVNWNTSNARRTGFTLRGIINTKHDYVEIGGVKWATVNIGAENPWDAGKYYQWGDPRGYEASEVGSGSKKSFAWVDYKYNNDGSTPDETNMTKYNSTDGKTVLDISDDGVHVAWGGKWRMPTTAEFQSLWNATTSAWTSDYKDSGVPGLILTDKVDSSKELFFPALGRATGGAIQGENTFAIWSTSVTTSSLINAKCFAAFDSSYISWDFSNSRCTGFNLRGVLGE